MSRSGSPREVFLDLGMRRAFASSSAPDYEATEQLRNAASSWRAGSQFFYAGYALIQAIHLAWGDGNLIRDCAIQAFEDFDTCCKTVPATSLEALAALKVWSTQLGMNLIDLDPSQVRDAARGLDEERGERMRYLGEHEEDARARAGFLVRGLHVATDFDGTWRSEFEDFEIEGNHTLFGGDWIKLGLESAFTIFIKAGDYRAAANIAEMAPDVFTTPGLRGWRAAVHGFLDSDQDVEWFSEAADQL